MYGHSAVVITNNYNTMSPYGKLFFFLLDFFGEFFWF